MGRSIGAPPALPDGRLRTHAGGEETELSARFEGSKLTQSIAHKGLTATYEPAYAVGAKQVGYTFLVQRGPYLFQSPLSFYRKKNGWDLTPGYEAADLLDLERPVLSGCLFCHTGSARPEAGSRNRFAAGSLTAISCERCHGPSERHLAKPAPGSIVNPSRLASRERDSVCEQCHLEGEIRILNPGRDWWDFHPGQRQEDTFVTFVKSLRHDGRIHAVSHSEQLAESRCARASEGKLWCGSCHNPHGSRENRAAQVRDVCLGCHQALFTQQKHAPAEQCTSCHMPPLRADNVAHAAVTDHRIPRTPERSKEQKLARYPVKPWREPVGDLRDRAQGLASYEIGAAQRDVEQIRRGYELLGGYLKSNGPNDAQVLFAVASMLLEMGDHRRAIAMLEAATHLAPRDPELRYALGVARERGGDLTGAARDLEQAIELDPSYLDAYRRLVSVYRGQGRAQMASGVISRYLGFLPESLRFRLLAR